MISTESWKLDQRFETFHAKHPEVYDMFVKFAKELRAVRSKGSAEQIVQRLRWETQVNPSKTGGFKFSNEFRRRYALKAADEHPELRDFFTSKRRVA